MVLMSISLPLLQTAGSDNVELCVLHVNNKYEIGYLCKVPIKLSKDGKYQDLPAFDIDPKYYMIKCLKSDLQTEVLNSAEELCSNIKAYLSISPEDTYEESLLNSLKALELYSVFTCILDPTSDYHEIVSAIEPMCKRELGNFPTKLSLTIKKK